MECLYSSIEEFDCIPPRGSSHLAVGLFAGLGNAPKYLNGENVGTLLRWERTKRWNQKFYSISVETNCE